MTTVVFQKEVFNIFPTIDFHGDFTISFREGIPTTKWNTPPKTNMEPENDGFCHRNLLFQGFIFRFHVSFFWEGNIIMSRWFSFSQGGRYIFSLQDNRWVTASKNTLHDRHRLVTSCFLTTTQTAVQPTVSGVNSSLGSLHRLDPLKPQVFPMHRFGMVHWAPIYFDKHVRWS